MDLLIHQKLILVFIYFLYSVIILVMNSLNQLASNLESVPSTAATSSIPPISTTASIEHSIEKMMQSVAQNAKESKVNQIIIFL